MSDEQDRQLIERIARGDATALQALYGRYGVRVYRFVVRIVRMDMIAEEVTNEVFMKVWRKASDFQGHSSVSTWLYTIARNEAISVVRKRSDEALDEEMAVQIKDDADTPDVVAAKKDKGDVMRQCVDKLSPAHREIIDLVYYLEKPVADVAEILGIPENTVKTRLFHARKQLSEHFRRVGIDRGWP